MNRCQNLKKSNLIKILIETVHFLQLAISKQQFWKWYHIFRNNQSFRISLRLMLCQQLPQHYRFLWGALTLRAISLRKGIVLYVDCTAFAQTFCSKGKKQMVLIFSNYLRDLDLLICYYYLYFAHVCVFNYFAQLCFRISIQKKNILSLLYFWP